MTRVQVAPTDEHRSVGTTPTTISSTDTGRRPNNESERLCDLFKYLAATSDAIGYTENDIDNISTYDASIARLSSDPILNALAQLTCFKVEANRAFINLIDEQHQNVVAEATATISLFDVNRHGPDGGLCVGSRMLDLQAGVCAGTMPAFIQDCEKPFVNNENVFADRSRYVIRDFRKEEKYKDRPYVTGFPYMRFYAEVPIVSTQGFVIGTLAAIDDKPRDQLSDDHFHALTELARTIMRHIELTMVDQHHVRAAKLLDGLNMYVQASGGAPDAVQSKEPPTRISSPSTLPILRPTSSDELGANTLASSQTSASHTLPASPLIVDNLDTASKKSPHVRATSDVSARKQSLKQDSLHHAGESLVPQDVRDSFVGASQILLDAMNLDGVTYFDASISHFSSKDTIVSPVATNDYLHNPSSYGSHNLADQRPGSSDDEMYDVAQSATDGASDPTAHPKSIGNDEDTLDALAHLKIPDLLASSSSRKSARTASSEILLPEAVLRSLLHRYPKGHVFDFSQEDDIHIGRDILSRKVQRLSQVDKIHKTRPLSGRDLEAAIRWALPAAQSAVFMPVWSPSKHTWLAGCLGWTSQHKRVLQQDELSYFSVFSNCMAADIARIELTISDRAKSDFISSISHEIRSPLHGILGSAELARQNSDDAQQIQLIEMIEKCGETLLDTMEHILDYAKISTASSNEKAPGFGQPDGPAKAVSTFELDEIVEDTVGTVLAGHLHNIPSESRVDTGRASYGSLLQHGQRQALKKSTKAAVAIVMDVQAQSSWMVESSVAAWRRIVLNIFGNALKYTDRGLIEVTLELQDVEPSVYGPDYNAAASLTVRDTGRGIGQHFLQNNLFTPFIQEDSMSVGTGLGLSIIKRIVQDLHGEIKVQSEVGIGTQVKVTVPVKVFPKPKTIDEPRSRGSINLLGLDVSSGLGATASGELNYASRTAKVMKHAMQESAERCHLAVTVERDGVDLIAISESNLHAMYGTDESGSRTLEVPNECSLLVLPAIDDSASSTFPINSTRVKYVSRPTGPRQIAAAIDALLAADRTGPLRILEQLVPASNITDIATASNARTTQPISTTTPPRPTAARATLLLVDDNDININMLSAQARKLSCAYETASNGQEALNLFKSAAPPFDYVLMDLTMPVMDGFASAREMRAWERDTGRTATPIIALTGLSSASAQQYALTSGIDLFMTKPVPMRKIEALVGGGVEAVRKL